MLRLSRFNCIKDQLLLLCINTLLFLLNQVFLQFKFGEAKSPCWLPNSSKIQIQNSKFTLSVSTDRGNLYEFYSIWNFLTSSGPEQITSQELANETITSHFGFAVEENSGKEIIIFGKFHIQNIIGPHKNAKPANTPFYSCLLSDLVSEWQRG